VFVVKGASFLAWSPMAPGQTQRSVTIPLFSLVLFVSELTE
jgi:hypothetical protein